MLAKDKDSRKALKFHQVKHMRHKFGLSPPANGFPGGEIGVARSVGDRCEVNGKIFSRRGLEQGGFKGPDLIPFVAGAFGEKGDGLILVEGFANHFFKSK